MEPFPIQVRARYDAPGRWLWLVKWLLLIPHYLVLALLWIAFGALTLIAYVAVLVTGAYPRGIFAFNVGVLRWSWRVGYYGYQVLGTDAYPPFTLADVDSYPAGLRAGYPGRLPRWRVFSWLLAVPHLLIVATLFGGWQSYQRGDAATLSIGLAGVVVLIAAIALLVTREYPRGLYDLLVGAGRWWLRVAGYVVAGAYLDRKRLHGCSSWRWTGSGPAHARGRDRNPVQDRDAGSGRGRRFRSGRHR